MATARTELFAQWLQGAMVIADMSRSTGRRFFVDSGSVGAGDTIYHGSSPDKPFLTIGYASTQCVANRGDLIFPMPGHNENLGAAQIALAIAGVSVIGVGQGADRPRIDFDNAAASIDVTANSVRLANVIFRASVTDILIGIDVALNVTHTIIENCTVEIGEDLAGVDEFILTIDLKGGNHDTIIRNNEIRSHANAAGSTSAVSLTAASERVTITNNVMVGNWSTAAIVDGAACFDLLIADNKIKVADGEPGIELTATTTGIIANNLIESTGIAPDAAIVAADCSWFNNFIVVADGTQAELIGTQAESVQPIGSVFVTTSAVTSSSIPNNTQVAGAITGTAVGTLLLEEIIVQTDGVGWATPTNIEFSVDNVNGLTGAAAPVGLEVIASFGANLTVSSKDFTTHALPLVLESGKKLYIHGDTAAGTGAGIGQVYCVWRRMTAGAAVAGANLP